MQTSSECINAFINALKLKDLTALEKTYHTLKMYFGTFVFEWNKGSIRFRKKLQKDTFFAKIENGCVELPKEGIAYLDISKNSYTKLHMFDNGQMLVSASAPLQRVFELGAIATSIVTLDVTDNILPLPEQHLKRAGLCEGDVLKIDIDMGGIFLLKMTPEEFKIFEKAE